MTIETLYNIFWYLVAYSSAFSRDQNDLSYYVGIVNIQSHLQRQIMPGTFLRIRIRVGNFSWMSISVEPLIEHIKDIFKIDPLPIRRCQKAAWIVLLSVLLYLSID